MIGAGRTPEEMTAAATGARPADDDRRGAPQAAPPRGDLPATLPGPWARPGRWLLAGTLLYLTALGGYDLVSADFGVLLRTGEQILRQGGVPRIDSLSYTASGRVWIEHRWAFAAATALLWRLGGAPAVILGKCLLILGIFAASLLAVPRRVAGRGALDTAAAPLDARRTVSLIVLGLAVPGMLYGLCERAQLVSYLALPLEWALLRQVHARPGRAWAPLLGLLAVQVVWANSHGSFPLGAALAGIWALHWLGGPARGHAPRAHTLLLLGLPVLLLAVSAVSPYGPDALGAALDHAALSPRMQAALAEWSAPDLVALALDPWSGGQAYLLALVATVWLGVRAATGPAPRRWPELGLLLLFGALSLRHERFVPPFLVVCCFTLPPLLLDRPLGRRLGRTLLAGSLLLAVPLHAAAWTRPGLTRSLGVSIPRMPVRAASFLERAGFSGNLFNSYDVAGYLILRLTPAARVYIDGRFPLYEPELNAEYFHILRDPVWGATRLAERGTDALLVAHRPPALAGLVGTLLAGGDWGLAWFDEEFCVLVRRGGRTAALLAGAGEFRRLRPWPSSEALARLAQAPAAEQQAWRYELARLRRELPGDPYVDFQQALLELALDRPDEALRLLLSCVERSPGAVQPRLTLARLVERDHAREAAVLYEEVLRLDPGNRPAAARLERLTPPRAAGAPH